MTTLGGIDTPFSSCICVVECFVQNCFKKVCFTYIFTVQILTTEMLLLHKSSLKHFSPTKSRVFWESKSVCKMLPKWQKATINTLIFKNEHINYSRKEILKTIEKHQTTEVANMRLRKEARKPATKWQQCHGTCCHVTGLSFLVRRHQMVEWIQN